MITLHVGQVANLSNCVAWIAARDRDGKTLRLSLRLRSGQGSGQALRLTLRSSQGRAQDKAWDSVRDMQVNHVESGLSECARKAFLFGESSFLWPPGKWTSYGPH